MKKWLFLPSIVALIVGAQMAASAAPVTFTQAVQDYSSGKFSLALREFSTIAQQYPSNALTHYYMALCHQALNHVSQAKLEYQFVLMSGDAKLKAHANRALTALSYSGASNVATASPALSGAGGPSSTGATKVKKVIEFYADW